MPRCMTPGAREAHEKGEVMHCRRATIRLAVLAGLFMPVPMASPADAPAILDGDDPAVAWTFERAAAELVRIPSVEDEFEREAVERRLSRVAILHARQQWLATQGPPLVEPEHVVRMLRANAQAMWAGHAIVDHRSWHALKGTPVQRTPPQARAELLWMGDRFVSRLVDLSDDRAGLPLPAAPHEVWSDGRSLWMGGPISGPSGGTIRAPLLAQHLVRTRYGPMHLPSLAMVCDVPRWILDSEGPEGVSRPVADLAVHLAWMAESRAVVVLPAAVTVDGVRCIIVTGAEGDGDRYFLAPSLSFAVLRVERVRRRFENGAFVGTIVPSVTVYHDHVEVAPGIYLPHEVTSVRDLATIERRGPARGDQAGPEQALRISHASVVHLSINEPIPPVLLEPRAAGLIRDELHGGMIWAFDPSGTASVEAALRIGIEQAGRRVTDERTARRSMPTGLFYADASIAFLIALAMVLFGVRAARRGSGATRRAGVAGGVPLETTALPFLPLVVSVWVLLSQSAPSAEAGSDGIAERHLEEGAAAARVCAVVAAFGAAHVLGAPDVTLSEIATSLGWAPGRTVRTDHLLNHLATYGHVRVVSVPEDDRESWLRTGAHEGARLLLFPPSETEDGHVALALGMTPEREILLLDYPAILMAIPVSELAETWSGSAIEVTSPDATGPTPRGVFRLRLPFTTAAAAACPFVWLVCRRGRLP